MHLGEPEIAALLAAAFAAENDVFLVQDRPFRPAQAERLRTVSERNLVVFLPGDYYPFGIPPTHCFFYAPHGAPARAYRFPSPPFVCWADIRLAGDTAFADAMEAAGVGAWILPFAECADSAQPYYRESFRQPTELRAASHRFTGLAALFHAPPETGFYTDLFGSRSALLLNGGAPRSYPAAAAETETEKHALVLERCEKQLGKRTAVFFPTRRQAEAFSQRLRRMGKPHVTAHGGKTHGENALSLARFLAGETPLLLATGHVSASAPFLSADRAVFCGLPLSAAAAARCAALLPAGEEMLIVHTAEDAALCERLARARAAAFSLPEAAFVARRLALRDELIGQLRH